MPQGNTDEAGTRVWRALWPADASWSWLSYGVGAGVAGALVLAAASSGTLGFGVPSWAAVLAAGFGLAVFGFSITQQHQLGRDRVNAERDEEVCRAAKLVEAAVALASAPHRSTASQDTVRAAVELGEAKVGYLAIVKSSSAESVDLLAQAGEGANALWFEYEEALSEAARLTLEFGRRVRRQAEFGANIHSFPVGPSEQPVAALVMLSGEEKFSDSLIDSFESLIALGNAALHASDREDAHRNFFVQTTDLLVAALDRSLEYEDGHSRRVAHIANRIGRKLGLEDYRLERLHLASLVHDIGMIKTPRDQYSDPMSNRTHPLVAFRMLRAIKLWEDLAPFVLHHHEAYDGSGFPEGKAGDDIPIESRIIGLAEAVDSMLTATGSEAIAEREVIERVRESSGSRFDPQIVAAFLELVRDDSVELG